MARLSDVPHAFRAVGAWGFVKRLYQQFNEDNVFTWAAALAYSWLFAVFPFLIFMMSLVPYIPEASQADLRDDVARFVDDSLPPDSASIFKTQVDNLLSKPGAGGFLSFGLVLTIWAASAGMSMTMYALDKAYDVELARPYWKQRSMAMLLTIISATFIILVLVLLPVGTGVLAWLAKQGELLGWMRFLIDLVRYVIAVALLFGLVAMIYYLGPSLRTRFHVITPGAVFTVTLWLVLGYLFNRYITQWGGAASYNKTYGAVAGMVILLLLFFLDAMVLLLGAEINSEIDFITLGLKSTPDELPEEAAARAAPTDPEKEALVREFQSKRREDVGGNAPARPRRAAGEAASAVRSTGANKWLLGFATLGVFLLIDKLRQRSRRKAASPTSPQRLKEMYPVTYAAMTGKPPQQRDGP